MRRYGGELIYRSGDGDSLVEVVDTQHLRNLHFGNAVIQSSMFLDDPIKPEMEYIRMMLMSLLFLQKPEKALMLGLGGGTLAKFLWNHFPGCTIDAVEMNPEVTIVSHRFFSLPDDPRLRIHEMDALHFLRQEPLGGYQIIFIDLYIGSGMDEDVTVPEFFSLCRRHLSSDGIVVWNMWQSGDREVLEKTLKQLGGVFGTNFLVLPNSESPNLVLLIFQRDRLPGTLADVKKHAEELEKATHVNFPELLQQLHDFKELGIGF